MEIKILEPKKTRNISCYILTFHFMHGDADGNSTDTAYFGDTDIEELLIWIPILDKMIAASHSDEYAQITDAIENDEIKYSLKHLCPRDITCPDNHASLTSYSLSYFNELGIEHNTKIIK